MRLHSAPELDYEHTAIEAVFDLFRGRETCRTGFTVTHDAADLLRSATLGPPP